MSTFLLKFVFPFVVIFRYSRFPHLYIYPPSFSIFFMCDIILFIYIFFSLFLQFFLTFILVITFLSWFLSFFLSLYNHFVRLTVVVGHTFCKDREMVIFALISVIMSDVTIQSSESPLWNILLIFYVNKLTDNHGAFILIQYQTYIFRPNRATLRVKSHYDSYVYVYLSSIASSPICQLRITL